MKHPLIAILVCSVFSTLSAANFKGTSKNCIFEFDQQTVNDNPYSKLL